MTESVHPSLQGAGEVIGWIPSTCNAALLRPAQLHNLFYLVHRLCTQPCASVQCKPKGQKSSVVKRIIHVAVWRWPETNNSLAAHRGGPSVNSSAAATMPHYTALSPMHCLLHCSMRIVRYIWMTASHCFATLYCLLHCTLCETGLL